MTTLKELKELDAKATSAPWETHEHCHADGEFWCSIGYKGRGPITDIVGEQGNKSEYYYQPVAGMIHLITSVEQQKHNAQFIAASRNIAPELIRVMKLMGEALTSALSMAQSECWPVEEMEIDKALSEYRKLKGE